jgi:hypothetical protein
MSNNIIITGNVNIETLTSQNTFIDNDPPRFPISSYTAHYGPCVQGVYTNMNDRGAYFAGNTITKPYNGGSTIYYGINIFGLETKIKIKSDSCVIKITVLLSYEGSIPHFNDIYEILRYDSNYNFEKSINLPQFSRSVSSLATGSNFDGDQGSTMTAVHLIAFDTLDSVSGTEYIYVPRVANGSEYTIYVNRTVANAAALGYEQTTSHLILEEYEYNNYSVFWNSTTQSWSSRSTNFVKKIVNDTFIVPAGITTVYISAMGAGGNGGAGGTSNDGGGGGGSGYTIFDYEVPVTPGETFTITIGVGVDTVITKPGGFNLTLLKGVNGGAGTIAADPNAFGGAGGAGGFGGGGGAAASGSPTTTTIAAGSNGVSLPTSIINVASTTNLTGVGVVLIQTNIGNKSVFQYVTFTGSTATSFTGCTGGVGVMSTGNIVTRPGSLGGVGTASYYGNINWNGGDGGGRDGAGVAGAKTGGNGAGPVDAGISIGHSGGGGGGPGGGRGGTLDVNTGTGAAAVANSGAGGGGGGAVGIAGGTGAAGWVIFEY